jgi:hypothetical protein
MARALRVGLGRAPFPAAHGGGTTTPSVFASTAVLLLVAIRQHQQLGAPAQGPPAGMNRFSARSIIVAR